jgi:hypothetical protein
VKILVIHHVEEAWLGEWEHEYYHGSTLRNLIDHLSRARYDKIIITTFEGKTGYPELDDLYPATRETWWYSDKPSDYDEWSKEENPPIIYNNVAQYEGHNWLYVYDWIKELKGHDVRVCGGHRLECLAGLLETMEHVGVKYKKIERCIYGD